MNRITLLFILSTMSISLNAKQIDEKIARKVAVNFYQSLVPGITITEKSVSLLFLENAIITGDGDSVRKIPVYYIFNINDSGFVIISAEDTVTPVIGYSTDGNFINTSVPDHISDWFMHYRDEIKYVVENGITADEEIKQKWNNLLSGQTPKSLMHLSVDPILETKWNQSPYYNDLCPGGSVTGCVATAMAQIMKHWNYPRKGTGSHSYFEDNYGLLTATFEDVKYDWANMISDIKSPNPAVATLMLHCGIGVNMNYGLNCSAAYVLSSHSPIINCSEYALKTYFGYNPDITGVIRASFSSNEWVNLLKKELNENRPVLYVGWGTNKIGHAFVCDGYDSNNFFHFNWGWGGNSDGYFWIDNLNPLSLGTGGGDGGYNFNQQMLIGIKPKSSNSCGANISPDKWMKFMCHNLGAANTSADPFTPSWEIIGGYWQWGRKSMVAPGPIGPSVSESNSGNFTVDSPAADNSWSDNRKTEEDPCPDGFRVPTLSQLEGLVQNNNIRRVGTWNQSTLNYSSGIFLGDQLFLPATGSRSPKDGSLTDRGSVGHYWSSTENGDKNSWILDCHINFINVAYQDIRTSGFSVRCIEDTDND